MNIDIKDIDEFNLHFVKPMVDAVRAEMQQTLTPLVSDVKTLKEKVGKLESNEKKAIVGWGVISVGTVAIMTYAKAWISQHFKVS
jgi:hypothetical protein